MPKKIGVMVGRERSFPDAFIAEVNSRNEDIVAEYALLGGTIAAAPSEYDVIIDRISHEVPYYQAHLKHAALNGTVVINSPFWKLADDKFFGTALADKLGVAVPKTVALPSHSYIDDITGDSLSNLKFPIDWESILDYTGLPAYLKPHWGGGWKHIYKVNSLPELWHAYNQTSTLCMILQESIEWEQYVRCICIGKTHVLITNWDPRRPHHLRYDASKPLPLEPELEARVRKDVVTLCTALGYEMNTVEFAVRDGIPYAIDFMNTAPDFAKESIGDVYFEWVINTMADYAMECAREAPKKVTYRWDALL
ncbi:MAG: hypothetical protein K1Y36_15960 [Blastocatellia bacterium]|nr:hypothetical protein [Blastocatellia bacterium]